MSRKKKSLRRKARKEDHAKAAPNTDPNPDPNLLATAPPVTVDTEPSLTHGFPTRSLIFGNNGQSSYSAAPQYNSDYQRLVQNAMDERNRNATASTSAAATIVKRESNGNPSECGSMSPGARVEVKLEDLEQSPPPPSPVKPTWTMLANPDRPPPSPPVTYLRAPSTDHDHPQPPPLFPNIQINNLPLPCIEIIRDELARPRRGLTLKDLYSFRLVCRRWNRLCNEGFWKSWLRLCGFGRAPGRDELRTAEDPYDTNSWHGQAIMWSRLSARHKEEISRFATQHPHLPPLPFEVIFGTDSTSPKSLTPIYPLVNRRPKWSRQEIHRSNYNKEWAECARFATRPATTGLMVAVDEYIPDLPGLNRHIPVMSLDGVTIADFWDAVNDWFDQPLTEPQRHHLRTLLEPLNPFFVNNSFNLNTAEQKLKFQQFKDEYPDRRSLATIPYVGLRKSKLGSLALSMVWYDHDLSERKWQPKSEIVKLKKTIKAKIFAAREWEGEMMDEEEQESADRGEIDA